MSPYDLPQPAELPLAEIASVRSLARREMDQRLRQNLFPYEGRWLAREALEEALRDERRRARVHAIELLLLCAALLGLSMVLYMILGAFMG
ncbi:MAG TPA: hypothetical protein VFP44_12485 [Usitatibacter sp.]|nr:hypothetical protein [Usitatibacter sp.]